LRQGWWHFRHSLKQKSQPPEEAQKRKARHKAGRSIFKAVGLKVLRRKPSVYVLPGLILGYAVALLDLAFEFLTAAVDGS
jgi:hypothetical protein